MELVIERDSFIRSLGKVQGIVEKRNAMPILSNTLLKADEGQLEILATDLEVTILDKCPVDMHAEGVITLNAKKLYDIVRELPEGPVHLKSGDDYRMEVKSGKIRFELMGISADDYPKVPKASDFKFVKVQVAQLQEMIQKTIYAAAGEDARFSLHGIYTEKTEDGKSLRMVATDGHRLALIERQIEKIKDLELSAGVIMPRKGMGEATRLLTDAEGEVGIAIKEKMAAFSYNDTVIFMKLVDGKFPDYRKVIIEGCDKNAIINKEELVRNLRRVSIMVDEKARAVRFSFSPKNLALESKNPNFGSSYSELEIEYDGEKLVTAFNDRYFIDIMNVSKSDNLKLELKNDQSPVIIRLEDDPSYTCVIMPMRI